LSNDIKKNKIKVYETLNDTIRVFFGLNPKQAKIFQKTTCRKT